MSWMICKRVPPKFFRYLALISLIALFNNMATAQSLWEFEKEQPLADHNNNNFSLILSGRLAIPELVPGYKGTGIRTDGYSTYLSKKLSVSHSAYKNVKGYFALETYPTDTAGFVALGTSSGNFISACVDRFGQVMLGINVNGNMKYNGSGIIVPKFKWLKVDLSINGNKVDLSINGKNCKTGELPEYLPAALLDSLIVGRDWRMKKVNIFPVTFINGIIDEISYSDKKTVHDLSVSKLNHGDPVLAVPGSRFKDDFSRAKYHLLPAANWTNETHGLLFYRGVYHIFNQKNGANLFLGQINWGHFTSPDLVHWTEQKPALTPEPGYDQNGIWSGCMVIDDKGKPSIIYTGGGENSFGICLASPTNEKLMTWKKYENNPVITSVPKEFSRKDFHDPYVWNDGGSWYMIIGFGLKNNEKEKGTVLLYKSPDLKKWEYLHPLFTGDPEHDDSGVFWEMPVFWKMNDKYILLVNKVPYRGRPAVALYWVGDFKNELFIPDDPAPKKLEVINRLLSPSVALDANHQTTAIAIIPDETSAKETYERGWTHLFSIPRIWTLENGEIHQTPHPALLNLRFDQKDFGNQIIDSTKNLLISTGHHQLEIEAEFIPGKAKKFGFLVGKDELGKEQTKIYYDFDKQQLVIDQTKSSQRKYVPLLTRKGDYHLAAGQKVSIHLFIDGSVIEGFINNKDAFTTRLFPLSINSNRVELFTENAKINLLKASVWQLKSTNNQTAF